MYIKKSIILGILFIFISSFNLQAQTFIQEASYAMGDDDSKIDAKNKAILIAKRECIEKAGVYVSSYSKSIKGILKNDTIESFSASIMKITVLDSKKLYSPERVWVKIKAEIDIELLNKKIELFNNSTLNVDDQIQSARDEIKEYNAELNKLLKSKNKKKELQNLQEIKKILIQKVTDLANNKDISFKRLEDKNYSYLNITSNVEDSEIYINNAFVGIAPIKLFKINSDKNITIKAVNDKRYYPIDVVLKNSFKRLSTSDIHLEFKKGVAELFFIGKEGSTLYINDIIKQELNKDNKVLQIKAAKDTRIAIQHKDGCYTSTKDLWANNTYEVLFTLDKQTCSQIKTSLIHNGNTYKMVVSPFTKRVWLDRNLGASKVCEYFYDEECYGDYFQWGRTDDGHEKTSAITRNISYSSVPNHSQFIISNKQNNYNWLKNSDDTLWQLNNNNNPCPESFRVPSADELLAETINNTIKNRYDAFNSFLKIPSAGYKYRKDGLINAQGISGHLWTNSTYAEYSKSLYFDKKSSELDNSLRANGYSLRCIKE